MWLGVNDGARRRPPLLIKFVRRPFRSAITAFFRFLPDVQSQRVPGFNFLGDSPEDVTLLLK